MDLQGTAVNYLQTVWDGIIVYNYLELVKDIWVMLKSTTGKLPAVLKKCCGVNQTLCSITIYIITSGNDVVFV